MRNARYSDEQIETAVLEVQDGADVAEITRKLGISEATFYVWRKRFKKAAPGSIESTEIERLRCENTELKRVVADLTFDRDMCKTTHAGQTRPPA